jgi:hypothetical protein
MRNFLSVKEKEVVVPVTSFQMMWKIFILYLDLSTDSKLRLRECNISVSSVRWDTGI